MRAGGEKLGVHAAWELRLHKASGLVLVQRGQNIVVNNGKALMAQRIVQASPPSRPTHFALGTGGNTPTEADTTLQTEVVSTRTALTPTVLGNSMSLDVTITATGAGFQEVGIFNAASAGTMLARFLVQLFDINAGESVEINWTLPVGGA